MKRSLAEQKWQAEPIFGSFSIKLLHGLGSLPLPRGQVNLKAWKILLLIALHFASHSWFYSSLYQMLVIKLSSFFTLTVLLKELVTPSLLHQLEASNLAWKYFLVFLNFTCCLTINFSFLNNFFTHVGSSQVSNYTRWGKILSFEHR